MGKRLDDFWDLVCSKLFGVGMILIDLMILIVLAGAMMLVDAGRDWLNNTFGHGTLFTQITLIVTEILFDLTIIVVVLGWLWDEIKRIFK